MAVQLLAGQAVLTLVISLLFWVLQGAGAAGAALYGGGVALLPSAYMAFRVFGRGAHAGGSKVLGLIYRAEAGKLAMTALLFLLGALWFGNNFAPLMITCMACLAVNWLMLAKTSTD